MSPAEAQLLPHYDRVGYTSFAGVPANLAMLAAFTEISTEASLFSPDTRILDVGCGDGRLGAWLHGQTKAGVWGIDPSLPRIGKAKTNDPAGNYLVFDAWEYLAGENAKFDLIFMLDFLEHLESPWQMVQLARGCLSSGPGGIVAVCPLQHDYVAHFQVYASAEDFRDRMMPEFCEQLGNNVMAIWR